MQHTPPQRLGSCVQIESFLQQCGAREREHERSNTRLYLAHHSSEKHNRIRFGGRCGNELAPLRRNLSTDKWKHRRRRGQVILRSVYVFAWYKEEVVGEIVPSIEQAVVHLSLVKGHHHNRAALFVEYLGILSAAIKRLHTPEMHRSGTLFRDRRRRN